MPYMFLLAALLTPPTAGGVAFEVPQLVRLDVPAGSGELYPLLADFDGRGQPSLLVGTTGGGGKNGRLGRLLTYPTARQGDTWHFGRPTWFDDANPTGLIGGG